MAGMTLTIVVGIATFGAGVVAGLFLHHRWVYTPLFIHNQALVDTIVKMKRRGFVPQFDIEQVRKPDPAAGVREF